jgi:heptosyltransferase-3
MSSSQMPPKLESGADSYLIRAARVWRVLREYRVSFGAVYIWLRRSLTRQSAGTGQGAGGRKEPPNDPKRILVIRLDAMGDLILSTPIFRELKLRYPNATLIAAVQQRNREILETNPYVDRILHPPGMQKAKHFMGLKREIAVIHLYRRYLQGHGIDIALHPRLGWDYYGANVLLSLVNAPVSLKYKDASWKGLAGKIADLAFRSPADLRRPKAQHEVISNAAIVERLTGRPCTSHPEIFLTRDDRAFAQRIVGHLKPGTTILGIAFGAQEGKRIWPMERWAEVVRLLARDRSLFIFVICSAGERAEGQRLHSMLEVESYLLSGARLRRAAACLEVCDVCIGTDSGPAHMAAAVGCKTVVISPHPLNGDHERAGSPVRWAPYSQHARVIQPETAIPPCWDGCDALEAHCILQLVPEQVAEACKDLFRAGEQDAIDAQALIVRSG